MNAEIKVLLDKVPHCLRPWIGIGFVALASFAGAYIGGKLFHA